MDFDGLPVCQLKPGDFYLALQPTLIKTVLGSCLTVTMYAPRTGYGAACHAMQPICRKKALQCRPDQCREKSRYVECIIPEMIRQLQRYGVGMAELEVKIFGGADMMLKEMAAHQRVGSLNIQKANEVVEALGLVIMSADVGGGVGRQLIFNTGNGDVWIKRFSKRR
jgi:chemotaxis protein CheD